MKSIRHLASIVAAGLLTFATAVGKRDRPGEDPEAAAARIALDGDHRQAARRDRGRQDVRAGGNAVDAACAMLAATATMWDMLSWGGETQALIYNPKTGKIVAINGLGVAPTGATAEFFRKQGPQVPARPRGRSRR